MGYARIHYQPQLVSEISSINSMKLLPFKYTSIPATTALENPLMDSKFFGPIHLQMVPCSIAICLYPRLEALR